MKGLYAIVDTKLLAKRGTDPIAYARALLAVRPAAIQLRAKDVSAREILGMLRALGPMCRRLGVPLVANDRADLAALAGCECVHIGQEDLPYELVHRIAPQLGVGISTHDPHQLALALAVKPRYVAYGPVFETMTKSNAAPVVGIEGLRQASRMARSAGVPLVAIGGITLSRVHELAEHVDACAVISNLYLPGATLADVTERARLFHAALGGTAAGEYARGASLSFIRRFFARRRDGGTEAKSDADDAVKASDDTTPPKPTKRTAEGPLAHLEGFPCQLGDVLMRLTGEEAWLAGGLVLSESAPVAALFVAPEAGHDCAIYARPQPREGIFWLEPLDPGAVLVGGEPATSVEHDGIRFDRVRRLPLRAKRVGTGAPDVGDAIVLAEYASAGSERLLVMRSTSGTSCAFRGVELEPSSYEVIASGRSTSDED